MFFCFYLTDGGVAMVVVFCEAQNIFNQQLIIDIQLFFIEHNKAKI